MYVFVYIHVAVFCILHPYCRMCICAFICVFVCIHIHERHCVQHLAPTLSAEMYVYKHTCVCTCKYVFTIYMHGAAICVLQLRCLWMCIFKCTCIYMCKNVRI